MANNVKDGSDVKEAFTDKSGKRGRGRAELATDIGYDDTFLDECRDIGIEEYAIRDGGDYRQLEKAKVFWLPLPELLEFEKADASLTDDDEFWKFFQDLIADKKLQTKQERTKKEVKSWDSWDREFDWKPQKISKWWSNWGYDSRSYGSSDSALTKKLAVALKAVNTTVSVINDTGQRFVVRLASEGNTQPGGPTSYTNFNEKIVVVSPEALLDTSIDTDMGVEVTSGFALHEGSHVKYTASLLDALTKPTELKPLSVASVLHNVLEDIRIEKLTAERFPGFKDYFGTALTYLWDKNKEHVPTQWGPELKHKVNAVIGMAKWPDEFEPTALADPGLTEQWPWWRDWAEGYVAGKEPIRMGVIRALERLAEDPQTKQEMDDLTEKEDAMRAAQRRPVTDEEFNELLKQLKEMLANGIDPCPSPGHEPALPGGSTPIELTADQAKELDRLLLEEYQTHEAFYKMHDGDRDVAPVIESERPVETTHSRQLYERAGSMAERLRSVFYFRKKKATEYERLLKAGSVDEEELWRVGLGDSRVFERSTQPDETFTSVTMLVDVSGSMVGGGLDTAQELANVMMACLRTQKGVRTRVRAHSTGLDSSGGSSCKIYRIWEPGDPDTRIGLLSTVPHGSNYDGFAIDWCAQELDATAQPGESKLLIVLSDGLPAGSFYDATRATSVHYGGAPAMEHMLRLSTEWGRRGVHVVQIAIDGDGIRPEDQARMFQHWVGYESDAKLLMDLTKVLSRAFGAEEI